MNMNLINDHFSTGRQVTLGTQHMIATPHYLASAVGLNMLDNGGSAIDALIAANAVLGVVYGHMCGLGGDLFAQVWDPDTKKGYGLNASGKSGENATIEHYAAKGFDKINMHGPLSAITVPGTVDGWWQLHQRFGKLEWSKLFQSAINYAGGFPVSLNLAKSIQDNYGFLLSDSTTSSLYLKNNQPLKPGTLLAQPDLKESFEIVADQGLEAFYRGKLAEKIVKGLQASGSILTQQDFASHSSVWVEPLETTYRGYSVNQLPPNSQGMAMQIMLNILENQNMQDLKHGSADYFHMLAEISRLVLPLRDKWITDPEYLNAPIQDLLSKEFGRSLFQEISKSEKSNSLNDGAQRSGGDTVYLTAVDSDGLAVSLIQSIFLEFGSGFIPQGTGIIMQNRGAFFSLDKSHPNALAPRKRTLHTLMPAMVMKNEKPMLVFGTMGGEGQPQTQLAILSNMIDYGFNVQEAIEAPRWLYGRAAGSAQIRLNLENRIPSPIREQLVKRGHNVNVLSDWSKYMGHAQAILIDRENGVLQGAADPRGDGCAIGR